MCLEKFLDETTDLVFMEFIANDGSEMDVSYTDNQKARFFERFLRKVMRKPSAPAVIMMQVRMHLTNTTLADGHCCTGVMTAMSNLQSGGRPLCMRDLPGPNILQQ